MHPKTFTSHSGKLRSVLSLRIASQAASRGRRCGKSPHVHRTLHRNTKAAAVFTFLNTDPQRQSCSGAAWVACRVEGTPVCRSTGEQIGVIQRLMIDKLSGQVAYAVLTFGGFLGFGQKHFPVPWRSLKYNVQLGAYEFDATEEQLRKGPSFALGEAFDWGDRSDEIEAVVRNFPVHRGWQ